MMKPLIYIFIVLLLTLSCNKKSFFVEKTETEIDKSISNSITDEKPKNGTYIYSVAFVESNGKITRNAFRVIIKDNEIKIVNNGILSGEKEEIIEQGIILKHKSGEWIIAHNESDVNLEEIGGCTNGPIIIDFKKKIVWFC